MGIVRYHQQQLCLYFAEARYRGRILELFGKIVFRSDQDNRGGMDHMDSIESAAVEFDLHHFLRPLQLIL